MSKLTHDQQAVLAAWQQHTYAEFVLKDADAALATMTESPYVFLIASAVARVGRAAVHEFYANKFLPKIPPDLEITSLSQTIGNDRMVSLGGSLPIRILKLLTAIHPSRTMLRYNACRSGCPLSGKRDGSLKGD